MATKEEVKLIEKMVRAKMHLEQGRARHRDTCSVEDPDSLAPCNCGASATNAAIDRAIKELSFE